MSSLRDRYSCEAIADRTLMETTSPIDAASGVARLSGFIFKRCAPMITAIMAKSETTKPNHINPRLAVAPNINFERFFQVHLMQQIIMPINRFHELFRIKRSH